MPYCDNPDCGAFVSATFYRVFSIDGIVHSCPTCSDSHAKAGLPAELLRKRENRSGANIDF